MSTRVVKEPYALEGFSLKRWSRRKLDAARAAPPAAAPVGAAAPAPSPVQAVAPVAAPATAASVTPEQPAPEAPLPPLDSLTFDSDLTAFFQPKIDEQTQRAALKKLLGDPRFNVMDGLDIYIDDYTKADPMPAGMLERLAGIYKSVTEFEEPAKSAAGLAPSAPAVEEGVAPDTEAGITEAGDAEAGDAEAGTTGAAGAQVAAELPLPVPGEVQLAKPDAQDEFAEAAPPKRTGQSA